MNVGPPSLGIPVGALETPKKFPGTIPYSREIGRVPPDPCYGRFIPERRHSVDPKLAQEISESIETVTAEVEKLSQKIVALTEDIADIKQMLQSLPQFTSRRRF